MSHSPSFIFVVCQIGSEALVKSEVDKAHPELRFAFSRPGFLTFKVLAENGIEDRFVLKSTFARTYGWSLENLKGENAVELAQRILEHPKRKEAAHIHIWQRDFAIPGTRGFEPGQSELVNEIGSLFKRKTSDNLVVNKRAKQDELVFDIALVEPNWWWIGWHFAQTRFQRWPGGTPFFETEQKISRAYYKLNEALLWSGITIQPGETCVELGSAPGGAVQLLLEKKAKVIAC